MRKILIPPLALVLAISLNAQTQKADSKIGKSGNSGDPAVQGPQLKNFNDSVSYALGLSLGKFYKAQGATQINTTLLSEAVQSAFHKDSLKFSDQGIAAILMQADQKFSAKKAASAKADGAVFLAKNKSKAGVVTLPDGLQYEVLKKGTGPKPTDTSNVKVHYKGTLLDGTEFDNSIKRGEPVDLDVNGVIKGWTEALQLMPEGSKWRLYVPSDLAYGDRGAGQMIPPGATLIFDIELIKINP